MGTVLKWLLGLIVVIGLALTGGYFFLKRDDIPYAALEQKYASADSQFIDLPGGVRAHFRDQGNPQGRTLLLLHGFSASLHTWEPWVKILGAKYHIVSVDLPGHGLTRAPANFDPTIENYSKFVNDFVDARKLTRFTLAGNSMGGNTAWRYTLTYPERVDALILVDAAGWPDTTSDPPAVFKLLSNPVIGPMLRDLDNTHLTRNGLEAAFINKSLVDDKMVARYTDMARAPGHRDILIAIMQGRDTRNPATPEALAAITVPTLVLTGDSDVLVPPAGAQKFADAIKGAKLVSFKGVGHVPMEEIPEESAAAVEAFLTNDTLEGAALLDAKAAEGAKPAEAKTP